MSPTPAHASQPVRWSTPVPASARAAASVPLAQSTSGRLKRRTALWLGAALVAVALVFGSTQGAYAKTPAQLWKVFLQLL